MNISAYAYVLLFKFYRMPLTWTIANPTVALDSTQCTLVNNNNNNNSSSSTPDFPASTTQIKGKIIQIWPRRYNEIKELYQTWIYFICQMKIPSLDLWSEKNIKSYSSFYLHLSKKERTKVNLEACECPYNDLKEFNCIKTNGLVVLFEILLSCLFHRLVCT